MSVYVRALATALARAGVDCDVFVRRESAASPAVIEVEPGFVSSTSTPVPRTRSASGAVVIC